MASVTAIQVARLVSFTIPRIACVLRPDVREALLDAAERERHSRGRQVLRQLVENSDVAHGDRAPLCQDTGTVWVRLEVGPDVSVPGDVFSLVDDAVAEAYTRAHLRMSVLADAVLDRTNTHTNTPAFCDLDFRDEPGATLYVMLKGGGSDNASRIVMLPPGAGLAGIEKVVLDCVREKAANACPPLVLGIGIGSTFDHVAGLAKRALLRPVTEAGANADPRLAELERNLLERINALGIGPGALGGDMTALSVRVQTAPCHIAALPVAVNMGCSAMRSACVDIIPAPNEPEGKPVLGVYHG